MKKLTKTNLMLLVSYLLFFKTAFGQNEINIFNTQVTLNMPVVRGEFPTGYPASIGSSHLYNYSAKSLGASDLTEVYNAVAGSLNMPVPLTGNPVLGAFFTTAHDGDNQRIIKENTHGLCFAFNEDSALKLYYFESNLNGKYDWVEHLSTRVYAITDELFISLQYCRFSPGSFPDVSTVFSFVCDSVGMIGEPDNSDLSIELSKDLQRQSGLFSLGMADSSILLSCERPNAEANNCGGACMTFVTNSSCRMVANMEGFVVYTCVMDGRHCAAGAIDRRRRDEGLELGVPLKFKIMRDFRDRIMTQYCESRKYIGFYYAFSKFAKMSVSMLWKYASVLPELYEAMQNMEDETVDNVIITPVLRQKALAILHEHIDIEDPYFRSMLVEVERDLEDYTGLKRSEVIALLTPAPNCTGARKSASGQSTGSQSYASVYVNPQLDEIVVNYSVSGTSIRFELFSSSAVLVSSMNSASVKNRLSISSSKLGPGIYYYRISSDSGYEKIGKVALVR